MIPPFLISIAANYGTKILSGLAVVAILSAGGAYLRHSIYTQGADDQLALCNKRDAETKRQGEELLKLKNHEIDMARQQSREDYLKALEIYGNENIRLTNQLNADINKRLYVAAKAKRPSCGSDAVPAKVGISESATARSGTVEWSELGGEDSAAIWRTRDEVIRMALLCKNQIEFIKKHAEVK